MIIFQMKNIYKRCVKYVIDEGDMYKVFFIKNSKSEFVEFPVV